MFRSVHSQCEARRGDPKRKAAFIALWVGMSLAAGLAGPVRAEAATASRLDGKALVMCEGKYALCDAAACTPIPEQGRLPGSAPELRPAHALCECVVETGWNLGPGPCDNRKPKKGEYGEYILSTYSFALPDSYLACPAKGRRTVCFGYPCLVDKDSKRAHCTCPIKYDSPAFWTQGGNCEQSACSDGLWQGGTPEEYAIINKIFGAKTNKTPPAMCGVAAKK